MFGVFAPRHDFEVHFDGDVARLQAKIGQKLRERGGFGKIARLAVDDDLHIDANTTARFPGLLEALTRR